MKKQILFLALSAWTGLVAQEHHCAIHKQQLKNLFPAAQQKLQAAAALTSHEHKYDVKFVHLDLSIERNSKYLSGHAKTIARVVAQPLDTFMTILHLNHTIDSMRFNGVLVTPLRKDSMVKVAVQPALQANAQFTVSVYYKGTAPSGGSAIGSGFSTGTSGAWGNQATWSLSESFVAYHWWPAKQVLTDKIDSSWVFITTDSTNKAGSNGILRNVVTVGAKKRYEWKSRYPIDYYLISIAVAKYKEYRLWAKPKYLGGDSILIQNFIYDNALNNANWISSQKPSLDQIPKQLEFLSEKYGMYPFYKEKYGNCMAPFGGGMEHQTMTSQGFFDYYINAHELGHQWWGDNVTCKSWADIWINEGFASYTEHLVAQYLDPANFASNLYAAHSNVMSQAGGKVHIPAADTMNTPRIFSSRLTYDKGGAIIHSLRFHTNNDSLWFGTLRGFQKKFSDSTASAADFLKYYQAQTSINATQFFNQWYYGEGYPTFNVKYNYNGSQCFIKSEQTVSAPWATPLFITPVEYRLKRAGKSDTTLRLMHTQATEIYTLNITGSVTAIFCDPNNWIINQATGLNRDLTLGPPAPPVNTAIGENIAQGISIGPNPTSGVLEIRQGLLSSGSVHVQDIQGRTVLTHPLAAEMRIGLHELPAGVYLVKICDSKGQEHHSQKIIKR